MAMIHGMDVINVTELERFLSRWRGVEVKEVLAANTLYRYARHRSVDTTKEDVDRYLSSGGFDFYSLIIEAERIGLLSGICEYCNRNAVANNSIIDNIVLEHVNDSITINLNIMNSRPNEVVKVEATIGDVVKEPDTKSGKRRINLD